MNYKIFSLIIGFTIWLMATIASRFAGHHFFLTENDWAMSLLYFVLIPALGFVSIWNF